MTLYSYIHTQRLCFKPIFLDSIFISNWFETLYMGGNFCNWHTYGWDAPSRLQRTNGKKSQRCLHRQCLDQKPAHFKRLVLWKYWIYAWERSRNIRTTFCLCRLPFTLLYLSIYFNSQARTHSLNWTSNHSSHSLRRWFNMLNGGKPSRARREPTRGTHK